MTPDESLLDVGTSYGLWGDHIEHLEERGIEELWPPQLQALDEGVTDDANFLMVSPPGTGKTLIAEIITVNEWVTSGNPSVYLVPYVALAEEKYADFEENLGDKMGLAIKRATETDYPNPADLFDAQIIVMTYEKFDYYLRNYPDYVSDISCAVVDEFHMISDDTRGPNLEVAITDLLTNHPDVRIVGLSATVPNPEEVSDWLDGAYSYNPDWRHNELHEGISLGEERETRFYDRDGNQIRTESIDAHFDGNYKTNAIIDFLLSEAENEQMGQALVFSPTRRDTKTTATSLANFIDDHQRSQDFGLNRAALRDLKDRIEDGPDSGKTESELKNCLDSGIGFHHAGLSRHAKSVLEEGFDQGDIKAIVATSTLAAGVNLPIKRVFVLEPKLGREEMLVSQYKNLAGRAGRPRLDEPGEAVLFEQNETQAIPAISNYINGDIDPLRSEIDFGEHYGVLLNLVREYPSMPQLLDFLNNTFRGHAQDVTESDIGDSVGDAVTDLSRWNMLEFDDGEFRLSELGNAASKQLISPHSIHLVLDYLHDADNIDIQDLLVTMAAAPEFDQGYRLFMDGRYWTEREEIREDLGLTHIDTDEFDNVITTGIVIYDWIQEKDLTTIYDDRHINDDYWGTADVRERIAPIFVRILISVVEVLEDARADLHTEHGDDLTQLAQRIRHGLTADGLPFATHGIERNRRRVVDLRDRVGIGTPEDLLDTPVQELATNMKERRAARYKRQSINRLLDGIEQDQEAVLLDVREQGLNAESFRELLSTAEIAFQNCVINELRRVSTIEVNEVDETEPGYDPEAYCYVYTPSGDYLQTVEGTPFEIALECKSKAGLDDKVGPDDATEILKKARDNSNAYVTVGTPTFTDDAKDAARETGVLLLDAPAFVAAMVRIQQGELDPDQIRDFFSQTGYLSRSDVYDYEP
jgi:helicase